MAAVMENAVYKSPMRKLVRFFERSRDGWKAKHHALKRDCKRLANQVAAVEKSREHWRSQARSLRSRVRKLEAELNEQKTTFC